MQIYINKFFWGWWGKGQFWPSGHVFPLVLTVETENESGQNFWHDTIKDNTIKKKNINIYSIVMVSNQNPNLQFCAANRNPFYSAPVLAMGGCRCLRDYQQESSQNKWRQSLMGHRQGLHLSTAGSSLIMQTIWTHQFFSLRLRIEHTTCWAQYLKFGSFVVSLQVFLTFWFTRTDAVEHLVNLKERKAQSWGKQSRKKLAAVRKETISC